MHLCGSCRMWSQRSFLLTSPQLQKICINCMSDKLISCWNKKIRLAVERVFFIQFSKENRLHSDTNPTEICKNFSSYHFIHILPYLPIANASLSYATSRLAELHSVQFHTHWHPWLPCLTGFPSSLGRLEWVYLPYNGPSWLLLSCRQEHVGYRKWLLSESAIRPRCRLTTAMIQFHKAKFSIQCVFILW